ETGICARLTGPRALAIEHPLQLVVPAGIQVEDIYPGHQHIDLVYFATIERGASPTIDPLLAESDRVGWYSPADIQDLGISDEIQQWVARALDALSAT